MDTFMHVLLSNGGTIFLRRTNIRYLMGTGVISVRVCGRQWGWKFWIHTGVSRLQNMNCKWSWMRRKTRARSVLRMQPWWGLLCSSSAKSTTLTVCSTQVKLFSKESLVCHSRLNHHRGDIESIPCGMWCNPLSIICISDCFHLMTYMWISYELPIIFIGWHENGLTPWRFYLLL